MPRFDLGKLVMTSGIQNIINEKPSYQYELVEVQNLNIKVKPRMEASAF